MTKIISGKNEKELNINDIKRRKKLKKDKLFAPYDSLSEANSIGNSRIEEIKKDIEEKEKEFLERFMPLNPKEIRKMHIPDSTLFYRNKMEYTFGDSVKGGPLKLGLHEKGKFHNIIENTDWHMIHYDFIRIRKGVRKYFEEKNTDFYHRWNHKGFLRHLVIRKSESENSYLLNLVTSSDGKLEDDFVKRVLDIKLDGKITSIYHTINDTMGDVIKPEDVTHIYGDKFLNEKLLGLSFVVGPFSFFQTNKKAAEDLYSYVRNEVKDVDKIWDLYAGSAVLGAILHDKAKEVYSVEINEENIIDAKKVIELNNITNIKLINDDCKNFVKREDKADLIVIDPPRMGLHPKVRESLDNSKVKEILYVSCNPKTMALDIKEMKNYEIIHLKGFYNFALTKHIEAVALLRMK